MKPIDLDPEKFGYVQQHSEPITVDPPTARQREGDEWFSFPLTWHLDQRGALVELFRASWMYTHQFFDGVWKHADHMGQCYISTTAPNVVKAWHLHLKQTDRFVCLRGKVVVGVYSLKTGRHQRIVLDAEKEARTLVIPPGVAHGWKNIGSSDSWILNICSEEYDGTDEYRRGAHSGPVHGVNWDWSPMIDG